MHGRRCCRAVWICGLLPVLLSALYLPAADAQWLERRSDPRMTMEGPPKRPATFRSVAELNQYLSDLTDYYTVLGRPRFGKRAGSSLDTRNFRSDDEERQSVRRYLLARYMRQLAD